MFIFVCVSFRLVIHFACFTLFSFSLSPSNPSLHFHSYLYIPSFCFVLFHSTQIDFFSYAIKVMFQSLGICASSVVWCVVLRNDTIVKSVV